MKNYLTKVPENLVEIKLCHEIREYVLRESFRDDGLKLTHYDSNHPVHSEPNQSLIFLVDSKVLGSVRLDKKFEHITFKVNEVRLALFGISLEGQREGYGRLFFNDIKVWCKENGFNTIYTNSRLTSHLFWKKMGFVDKQWDTKLHSDTEIQMVLKI